MSNNTARICSFLCLFYLIVVWVFFECLGVSCEISDRSLFLLFESNCIFL